jgi:hypothetical protein
MKYFVVVESAPLEHVVVNVAAANVLHITSSYSPMYPINEKSKFH